MKKTLKIGWQKYEDVIESQLNSPIIDQLYSAMMKKHSQFNEVDLEELEEEGISPEDLELFHLVDTEDEVITILDDFYKKSRLSPNF